MEQAQEAYNRRASAPYHVGLTAKQMEVYLYLRREITTTGVCPSYREMMAHFKIGNSALYNRISCLVERGYLRRTGRDRARSLALAEVEGSLPKNMGDRLEEMEYHAHKVFAHTHDPKMNIGLARGAARDLLNYIQSARKEFNI